MEPASVGVTESRIVLGKHSGRHALSKRVEDLGQKLSREELDELYREFTSMADNKKGMRNSDIIELIGQIRERGSARERSSAEIASAK